MFIYSLISELIDTKIQKINSHEFTTDIHVYIASEIKTFLSVTDIGFICQESANKYGRARNFAIQRSFNRQVCFLITEKLLWISNIFVYCWYFNKVLCHSTYFHFQKAPCHILREVSRSIEMNSQCCFRKNLNKNTDCQV